jgi:hypothetical protein
MTHFITRLAERTLGVTPVLQPRIASRFAPGLMIAGDALHELTQETEGKGSAMGTQNLSARAVPAKFSPDTPSVVSREAPPPLPARPTPFREVVGAAPPHARHTESNLAGAEDDQRPDTLLAPRRESTNAASPQDQHGEPDAAEPSNTHLSPPSMLRHKPPGRHVKMDLEEPDSTTPVAAPSHATPDTPPLPVRRSEPDTNPVGSILPTLVPTPEDHGTESNTKEHKPVSPPTRRHASPAVASPLNPSRATPATSQPPAPVAGELAQPIGDTQTDTPFSLVETSRDTAPEEASDPSRHKPRSQANGAPPREVSSPPVTWSGRGKRKAASPVKEPGEFSGPPAKRGHLETGQSELESDLPLSLPTRPTRGEQETPLALHPLLPPQESPLPTAAHQTTSPFQEKSLSEGRKSIVPRSPPSPPTIQVTIGQIEVRAVQTETPQPSVTPAQRGPALSLDDYLRQRNEGQR